ncbi:MAG TPA: cytochrome c [Candidatus Acidoferrum sp.]|nr:cytochrome c [Candidatus Acidoferrum sp.]
MNSPKGRRAIAVRAIGRAAALCALAGFFAGASLAQQKPTKKAAPTTGIRLYKENCAVCHGNDGKGNGPPPATSAFAATPPDLTTLAKRHEGTFPDAYVESVLRNGTTAADHGPAEMPVWGALFKAETKSDEAQVSARIRNLTSYLKSIQEK